MAVDQMVGAISVTVVLLGLFIFLVITVINHMGLLRDDITRGLAILNMPDKPEAWHYDPNEVDESVEGIEANAVAELGGDVDETHIDTV